MSTIAKVNFEPKSNLLNLEVRNFSYADKSLANPQTATALIDGEWMTLDASYKLVRAADISAAGNAATAPSWPLWAEKGRYDVQSLGEPGGPVVYLGAWEADTTVFDASGMTVGGYVSVSSVDIGGTIYSGLVANGTAGTPGAGVTVGVVTRLPTANGGKLRIRGGNFY